MAIQKKQKLSDRIIEEIRDMVVRGELTEGSKLPNQTDFAAQLGVSRLSLREALHTLEQMGLITQAPKIGTVIANANPALWQSGCTVDRSLDIPAFRELIDARNMIELSVAPKTVEAVTEEHIRTLEGMLSQMDGLLKAEPADVAGYAALDAQFHMILIEIAGNRYLTNFYSQILVRLTDIIQSGFSQYPAIMRKSAREHRQMIKALKEKDPAEYLRAVDQHISDVSTVIDVFYGRQT